MAIVILLKAIQLALALIIASNYTTQCKIRPLENIFGGLSVYIKPHFCLFSYTHAKALAPYPLLLYNHALSINPAARTPKQLASMLSQSNLIIGLLFLPFLLTKRNPRRRYSSLLWSIAYDCLPTLLKN